VQRSGERFQLHEVLRQFAAEKLSAADQARQAHAGYFADWAAACAQMDERQALALLADELENVRAAWLWSCQQQDAAALAGSAPLLKRYLDVQGRHDEGLALFQHALSAFDAPANADGLTLDNRSSLLAQLMMVRALFLANSGNPAEATPVLTSCLAYFQRAGDLHQVMVCQSILGKTFGFLGQPEQAAAYFRAHLEAARALNIGRETATALNNLATTMTTLHRPQEAERLLRECLALRRELGDDPGLSSTLINLAVALFNQGRYAEEKPLLAEAIEISRRINQPRNLAGALGNLGTILVREGQHEAALKLFQQGLEIHRNAGYRYGTAIALDNVGTAHYHLGHEREARYYLHQAAAEARAIRADFVALDAAVWLAGLAAREGDREGALAWLDMIRRHPQVEPETVQNIEKLLPEVAAGLSQQAVQAAETRSQRLTLDDLAPDALRYLPDLDKPDPS
jgi:tetratricopeptide (TPR) repeat protein